MGGARSRAASSDDTSSAPAQHGRDGSVRGEACHRRRSNWSLRLGTDILRGGRLPLGRLLADFHGRRPASRHDRDLGRQEPYLGANRRAAIRDPWPTPPPQRWILVNAATLSSTSRRMLEPQWSARPRWSVGSAIFSIFLRLSRSQSQTARLVCKAFDRGFDSRRRLRVTRTGPVVVTALSPPQWSDTRSGPLLPREHVRGDSRWGSPLLQALRGVSPASGIGRTVADSSSSPYAEGWKLSGISPT